MNSKRSIFARLLSAIWQIVDGTRKVVLNLVFLLILYVVVLAFIDSTRADIVEM